ncbi:MAG: triose-phosphate isomerase [Candidatus Shapirobacteria bacterium]
MIFVNFKDYPNGKREKGQQLVEICRQVQKQSGVPIYPVIDGRFEGGVLLNHSSRPMTLIQVKNFLTQFSALKTLVCCSTIEEGKSLAALKPCYLAYEVPELVGGRVAVSMAQPRAIRDLVESVRPLPVLAGAGVHQKEDVIRAVQTGAVGVLVSAAVMTALEPEKVLKDLAEGFK